MQRGIFRTATFHQNPLVWRRKAFLVIALFSRVFGPVSHRAKFLAKSIIVGWFRNPLHAVQATKTLPAEDPAEPIVQ